jgi:hypothetical protein
MFSSPGICLQKGVGFTMHPIAINQPETAPAVDPEPDVSPEDLFMSFNAQALAGSEVQQDDAVCRRYLDMLDTPELAEASVYIRVSYRTTYFAV